MSKPEATRTPEVAREGDHARPDHGGARPGTRSASGSGAAGVPTPAGRDSGDAPPSDVSLFLPDSKREHERIMFELGGVCTEIDQNGKALRVFPVRGYDLSRSGMGLLSPSMIHTDRRVFLRFQTVGGQRKLLFGVVRYSRYSPGKGYIVGVGFMAIPNTRAFKELMDEAARS